MLGLCNKIDDEIACCKTGAANDVKKIKNFLLGNCSCGERRFSHFNSAYSTKHPEDLMGVPEQ